MTKLGTAIRKCREQVGMTRDELAGRIHVSKATLYQYETKNEVPLVMQMQIAQALGVPLKHLRGGIAFGRLKNTEDDCVQLPYRIEDFSREELSAYRVEDVERES